MNSDITISLIGFSDGSNQFSTACIYPVSYNVKTNEVHTSLDYGPVKEIHGLFPCTTSITRFVEGFQECNIALNGCNVDIVEVSQIIALRSPPCLSKSKMKKYRANIEAARAKTLCFNNSEKCFQSSRSSWEIRHRQGSRIKVDEVCTKNPAPTMVTAESRYLLQDNFRCFQ